MFRTTLRSASRPVIASLRSSARAAPRRFNSTAAPSTNAGSWKGSALRWGLAAGAVYYYNTSPVFADDVARMAQLPLAQPGSRLTSRPAAAQTVPAPAAFSNDDLPTVDSVLEEKRKQIQAKSPDSAKAAEQPASDAQSTAAAGSPLEALEEDAGQQGAFNPETGEINWDCPCLGGMADGPCGEDFKTAFSCFVFSEEDPKGMDCIDKFQGMQECFKKYPEIYGAELADDEDGPDFGEEEPSPDAQKVQAEPVAFDEVKPEAEKPVEAAAPAPTVDTTPEVKEEIKPVEKVEQNDETKKE
ncbi:hypothetical protein G7Z17_g2806 [Cylindrodendrum hubeiense]|uniref:Mitochondrial intermembrane space import and assembly protein 40 n=1 Tax=Cylindrodendrum hubeiense TaxID=595255 RepID=A0A9P5LIS1_9HYPO|nr:hypothetical protein G7Z17_g2806 [Cylindrodendrum hubeiense]